MVKKLLAVINVAASACGCVPTIHETLAVTCSEYIGRPISERIAALGPPKAIYRIDPNQLGYVFESSQTAFFGGHPYYTVNYLVGVDKHRTAIYPVRTTCSGTFIVRAPSDATPVSQRIIIDVLA